MNSNLGKQKFFVIYQITNLINGKIYVGAHITYNVNDKYMGSSKYLKKDMKELGRKNFKKIPLHVFDNSKAMQDKEAEIVTKEFCHRDDTYNRMIGGITEFSWVGMTTVKDRDENTSKVYLDDPRYLSGELVGISKGMATVRDKEGNIFNINTNDSRYISRELKPVSFEMVPVKDMHDNYFKVSIHDPKYLSGEFVHIMNGLPQHPNSSQQGKHHTIESKKAIGKANSLIQTGAGNSQFGTCWIMKENENKKIKKEDLDMYLQQGWAKGRKQNINKLQARCGYADSYVGSSVMYSAVTSTFAI